MEINDLLSLIGVEKPEDGELTLDTVREHINSTFIPVNDISNRSDLIDPIVNKGIGQRLGSLQTALISQAKEAGLDVKHKDFEGQKLEDIVPTIFGGFKSKLEGVKKPDSKVQEELERYKTEMSTYQQTIESLEAEKNNLLNDFKVKEQGWVINHANNQAWESLRLSPQVDELKKIGFKTRFDSQYELKTDENGQVFPVYRTGDKKGSRVQNPAKLSEYLGLSELLNHEAKTLGLLAEANEGKPGAATGSKKPSAPAKVIERPTNVRINPRFARQE